MITVSDHLMLTVTEEGGLCSRPPCTPCSVLSPPPLPQGFVVGLLCSIPDIPPHKVQKLHLGLLSDAQNDVLWLESQAWDAWESAKGLLLPLSAGAGGSGSFGGCGVRGGPAARGNKQPPEVPSQRLAPTLPQMCCVAWAQLCRACLHHLNSFLAGIEDATRQPLSLLQTEPALYSQPPPLSSLVALHWTRSLVLGAQNRMIQSLDGVSLGLS